MQPVDRAPQGWLDKVATACQNVRWAGGGYPLLWDLHGYRKEPPREPLAAGDMKDATATAPWGLSRTILSGDPVN
jgi:hypothetical protein